MFYSSTGEKTVSDLSKLADIIQRDDPFLIDYLLSWSGLGAPMPWGAATGFALEVASGMGLIRGESDATLTVLGKAVAEVLAARHSAGAEEGLSNV